MCDLSYGGLELALGRRAGGLLVPDEPTKERAPARGGL